MASGFHLALVVGTEGIIIYHKPLANYFFMPCYSPSASGQVDVFEVLVLVSRLLVQLVRTTLHARDDCQELRENYFLRCCKISDWAAQESTFRTSSFFSA